MKGVIFTVFEEFLVDSFGDDVLEDVYAAVPEVGDAAFVSVESYPDEWLMALVRATCVRVGLERNTAIRTFGRFAFRHLAGAYPVFLEAHTHPKTFLAAVDGVIHVEVRKLFRGAQTPVIWTVTFAPVEVPA